MRDIIGASDADRLLVVVGRRWDHLERERTMRMQEAVTVGQGWREKGYGLTETAMRASIDGVGGGALVGRGRREGLEREKIRRNRITPTARRGRGENHDG